MSTARRCFVMSPIGGPGSDVREHADLVFDFVIEPALQRLRSEGLDIVAVRSDHLEEPGTISTQMFRELFQDDLCIALLTYSNANVFYELAVAQCAFRPVVALVQEGDPLPFDVADLRTISYDLKDPRRVSNQSDAEQLAGQVRTVLDGDWTPPNPFGSTAPVGWEAVRDPSVLQRTIETARPRPLPAGVDSVYRLPGDDDRRLVVRTGDVRHVRDVDVVVSSENTDLQLARYYDPSISGTLRYLDAERGLGGRVVRDALNERLTELITQHDIQPPVMPGTVLPVHTSGLRSRGIKYLLLAATVRGDGVGAGYSAVPEGEVENCLRECFQHFDVLARTSPITSMLFPVFGAGTARQDPEHAVALMLPVLVDALRESDHCREIHVLAWVESHRVALRRVALRSGLVVHSAGAP